MEMMAGKRITCCKMASDVVRLDRIKAKPKPKKKKLTCYGLITIGYGELSEYIHSLGDSNDLDAT